MCSLIYFSFYQSFDLQEILQISGCILVIQNTFKTNVSNSNKLRDYGKKK